jgi:hypothetical protein
MGKLFHELQKILKDDHTNVAGRDRDDFRVAAAGYILCAVGGPIVPHDHPGYVFLCPFNDFSDRTLGIVGGDNSAEGVSLHNLSLES